MKLYLLKQEENTGYDTYDSIVVAANSREEARKLLPNKYIEWDTAYSHGWCNSPEEVEEPLYIGEAAEGIKEGVIITSFNAG